MFSEYGEVESIAWINDRDTGRFRGFCFIEMESKAADAAIEALDGKDVGGRNLRVNEAKPREKRSGGGGGRSGGYSGGSRRNDYSNSSSSSSSGGSRW